MLTKEEANELWDKIRDIRTGMLTTRGWDEYGHSLMHARPMCLVQDEFDGALWFFTDDSTAKVEEIEENPQVCVTFCDARTETYVSLTGYATLENDPEKIDQLWNVYTSAYFPQGKDGGLTSLIRVAVQKAEYWEADSNKMIQLFEIAKAHLFKEYPDLGENRKLG